MCLLLTSSREGYGLVVVEAASHGTPSVVVAGPDNAATELIVEGVNGTIAPEPQAAAVAEAIVRDPRGRLRAAPEHRLVVRRERDARCRSRAPCATVLAPYDSARA